MKTVSIRLTDKQHHYLAAVAKDQMRSVEHLIWLALSEGISYMFNEETYYVEKLQCDFTDEEVKSMEKYPLHTPTYGTDYYGDQSWAENIKENVLADIEGSLIADDAAFDLQLEINRTAELHAQRKQDYEAKEAAKREQEAAQ
jgi:hypothetical protein